MKNQEITYEIEKRVAELDPAVEVVAVERFGGSPGQSLRVYIDHPEGVNHELCAEVTGCLRDLLKQYSLEVSSPGIERLLTKPDHFKKYMGEIVGVKTVEQIEGSRRFKGELVAADDVCVTLAQNGQTVQIPHNLINKSRLIALSSRKAWVDE